MISVDVEIVYWVLYALAWILAGFAFYAVFSTMYPDGERTKCGGGV